ncbi:hypothetical protein ACHAWC_010124 [Mediolabrus comicus]
MVLTTSSSIHRPFSKLARRADHRSLYQTSGRVRRQRLARTTTGSASSLQVSVEDPPSSLLSDTRDVKNDDLMFFVSEEQEKNNTTAGFTEIIQTQSKTLGEETDEQHDMDRERMGNDVEELTHTHLLGRDETDLHHHLVSPSIPVSYDENGIVYADVAAAATVGMTQKMDNSILIDEQQDYPDFIKFLYRKDQNGQTLASKLFNFTILAVSFGYVFFSVFNIDKGMTRGWSPSEIGMRIPLDTWASYENSLSEKPVATKTIINVVIYLLGDWLSQTLFQQKNVLDFDAARTIKNGLVGMCFGPAVHEYYEFSDWILPVDGVSFGITNRAFKILMDQTIYLSIKCSIYIIAIGVLNGDSLETGSENVKTRIKPIMFTAWKFWPLVHCVTYGLIPARHRILWVNSVDLVWNAILASKARGDVTEDRANDDDSQHNENEADKQQNNSGPII